MRGAASLVRKDSTLVSDVIEYDVDTDRYSASGEGGINVQFSPDD
jgi:lipopolysaccharide export system protein LptA